MRMTHVKWLLGLSLTLTLLLASGDAKAGDEVLRGSEPPWVVKTAEVGPDVPNASSDGLRVLLFDAQVHADEGSDAVYMRIRSMALSPQALPVLGQVGVAWSPASQEVTVHHVNIIRDGQTIDALDGQTFEILRREQNLEQSMLDGQMTAVLQPAGLRVGDILDVAYTLVSRDPVTGGHFERALDLNLPAVVDQVRYRASWPSDRPVRVRAVNDWAPLAVRRQGAQSAVEVRLDDLQPVLVPDDVPGRLRVVRGIELSDYRDWSEIAVTLKPLYDRARRLQPDSPLHAEIERIRALSDDPAVRAAAALRLVQDEVRYVALMMGEGALTPATADETWNRRFGDCKGKTALLLALLDGLGIEAQPAAVSIANGDGMADRLPMVGAFDHVLVRTDVGGATYWLDGARAGDRILEDVAVPPYRWALPLTGPDAQLEPLRVTPRTIPDTETIIATDASAGLHAPAGLTGSMIMRGDAAAMYGGQIGLIPASQRDEVLRSIWASQLTNPTITEVDSTYDAATNVLTLTMTGSITLQWRSEGLIPPGATYLPITSLQRSEGPFRDAPYAINHPSFSRQTSTLRLPRGGQGFSVSGGAVDRTELGHEARRTVAIDGDLVTVEVTIRSLTDEITAKEADGVRAEALTRPFDPPRVFQPRNYQPSEADRAAWAANAPETASGWLDRALALSESGDAAGAVEAAGRAIALEPDNSAAWANRGVYRFWTGDHEGAAADLDKAVDIDPSERIAMNGNALLAMEEGRYDDAIIELSRALRQAPGDGFALGMRARAYMAKGEYDRVIRDLDALIAAQPTRLDARLNRIAALELSGQTAEVDAALAALVTDFPDDQTALLTVAAYQLAHDRPQEAFDTADRLIAGAPDADPALFVSRGEAAIALGRLDLAAQDFQTVRGAAAGDPTVLNDLCWTAALAGVMLDQALLDCEAALVLEPESAAILDSKGRVLLQAGDPIGALAAYDAALARAPNLPASLYGRGLARLALGDSEAGEADKAAALAIYPGAAEDFENYAPSASSQ